MEQFLVLFGGCRSSLHDSYTSKLIRCVFKQKSENSNNTTIRRRNISICFLFCRDKQRFHVSLPCLSSIRRVDGSMEIYTRKLWATEFLNSLRLSNVKNRNVAAIVENEFMYQMDLDNDRSYELFSIYYQVFREREHTWIIFFVFLLIVNCTICCSVIRFVTKQKK